MNYYKQKAIILREILELLKRLEKKEEKIELLPFLASYELKYGFSIKMLIKYIKFWIDVGMLNAEIKDDYLVFIKKQK